MSDGPVSEPTDESGREAQDAVSRADTIERLKLLGTDPTERFDRLTRIARDLFGAPLAMVTLLDDTSQHVKSHTGASTMPRDAVPLSDAICTETIRADRTFVVEDASADARFEASSIS